MINKSYFFNGNKNNNNLDMISNNQHNLQKIKEI